MLSAKVYNFMAKFLKDVTVSESLPKQHQGKLPYQSIHYYSFMDSLCDAFKEDNPNFNRRQFLKAADCPYFDESRMGVPCEYRTCKECGDQFVEPLDDRMSKICPKCERRWNSE